MPAWPNWLNVLLWLAAGMAAFADALRAAGVPVVVVGDATLQV